MKKRIITTLLILSIATTSLVGATAVTASAAENTQVAAASVQARAASEQAAKLVEVAKKEVGYKEGNNNKTKYGAWYGLQNQPWCAMFVSWCANQAGIPKSVIPKHASCSAGVDWFKEKKQWKGKNYTPKKGDLIYFTYSHVGIVDYVSNGRVYTIEGNTSDMVKKRNYEIGSSSIKGYGVPKYTK